MKMLKQLHPLIEWNAFKTVIRGRCFGEVAGVRRTLVDEVETQERVLRSLEQHRPDNPALKYPLLEAKKLLAAHIEKLCFDYKEYLTRAHAERDKAGSLLKWLINTKKLEFSILELDSTAGEAFYNQAAVNARFCEYYTYLYAPTSRTPPQDTEAFFFF